MCALARRAFGLENALLGFLNRSPQHGYQLHQRISDPSGLGMIWRVKQSQLYALLEKLEESGFVTSVLEVQEKHLPRRVFSLTEIGAAAYQSWLITPVKRPYQLRQEFLAKLYFALQEGPVKLRFLIERQQEVCQQWLADLEKEMQKFSSEQPFAEMVLRYRTGQVKAILSWLNEIIPSVY